MAQYTNRGERGELIKNNIRKVCAKHDLDMMQTLKRYALERLALRLFALKGAHEHLTAMAMVKGGMLWHWCLGDYTRSTSDIDLQIFDTVSHDDIVALFQAAGEIADDEDAMTFEIGKVQPLEHSHGELPGIRIYIVAHLGGPGKSGRGINISADIGVGGTMPTGAVYDEIETVVPGMWTGHVRMQPLAFMAAEKVHAIVDKGLANTRMKDYRDLHVLSSQLDRMGGVDAVCAAFRHTFEERMTEIPSELPEGLTAAFAAAKQAEWERYLSKNGQAGKAPSDLLEVVERLAEVYGPVLASVRPAPAVPSRKFA